MLDFFRSFSLSFPKTSEQPHFEKTSIRVRKNIFATQDFTTQSACLKLSEKDQDLFLLIDPKLIFPLPTKWGNQGWTLVKIEALDKELINDLLNSAFNQVAPENLKLAPKSPYL